MDQLLGGRSVCVIGSETAYVGVTIPLQPTATPRRPTATPTSTPTPTPRPLGVPVVTVRATGNEVTVSWDSIPGASKYDALWWKSGLSGWQDLKRDTTKTSLKHSNLTPGTKYWYTVSAEDNGGRSSPWSEYVNVTIPTPTNTPTATPTPTPTSSVPAPVLSVREDLLTHNSLSWTGIGVSGVSYYSLQRNVPSENNEWVEIGTSVVTSYSDTQVTPGKTYRYRVSAMASVNNPLGGWSNIVTRSLPTSTPEPTATTAPSPTPTAAPTKPAKPDTVQEHTGCFGPELTCYPFLWPWAETWVTWSSDLVLSGDFQDFGHFDVHVSKVTGTTVTYQRTDKAGPYLYYQNDQVEPNTTYQYKVRSVRRISDDDDDDDLYSEWTDPVDITTRPKPSVVAVPYATRKEPYPDIVGAQKRCIEYSFFLQQNCQEEAPSSNSGASGQEEPMPTPTATPSEGG
ncbi:MAG: fibronectin type III domain-containing protein [Caldilineaceae bacterium SB0665_bin_25]|nr:fibronectin type III domain-containing protein [Caldilineaceae bacterium SB0665_bin_25]